MVQLAGAAGGTPGRPSSPRKLWIELWRRSWLVVLSTAVVGLVAWGVAESLARSYTAEAVLVVRVGGPLAAQPDASTKLASTYATLLPLDAGVRRAIAGELPGGTDFTASSDANTAVVRIEYSASSTREAERGAAAIATAVSGPIPPSAAIQRNTLQVVRLPDSATRSGGTPAQLAAVGALLGVLLGLVLVAFWRARDARIDDVRELRDRVECPCFEVNRTTAAGSRALIEALATSASRTTVMLPCRRRDTLAAELLRTTVGAVLGEERALCADPPGSAGAGELVAAAADATVLVATRGIRIADLTEALDILRRYGAQPAYAVLAGSRGSDERPGVVLVGAERSAASTVG